MDWPDEPAKAMAAGLPVTERGFLKNREDGPLLGDLVERVVDVGMPEGFPGR